MEKVIFVTNYLGNGGAARVMSVLANYLSKKNTEIEVVSFLEEQGTYKIDENIKFTVLDCKCKNSTIRKIERIMKLRKILKQSKGAIIIAFEYFVNMQTILANSFLHNKIIVSERNDPYRVGNAKITSKLRNLLYKHADYLVCQTPDAKAYFPKKIQEKTVIISNPIMPNLPKRFEGERKKKIVTFCRIEKQKNLKLLIDAFELLHREYNEYTLIIYGDGSEKLNIAKYIEDKGLTDCVELAPFVFDIHKKILNSAMFVSSSDYEGISNSMLEAMGIGLPTIVTDCPCGGARMMIENEKNGILVPVGNVNALYKAMKKVIENPDFAMKLSENAIEINDRLEQGKICKEWLELI